MSIYPCLRVIDRGYGGHEDVPHVSEVLAAVKDGLERAGWPHDHIVDAFEGDVEIQHEYPPEDPVTVYGVTIVFAQSPTQSYINDPRFEDIESPFLIAINAVYHRFDEEVEVWIDATDTGSSA